MESEREREGGGGGGGSEKAGRDGGGLKWSRGNQQTKYRKVEHFKGVR